MRVVYPLMTENLLAPCNFLNYFFTLLFSCVFVLNSKYKRISDKDQRQKYKQDFNREYEEYMVLHSNIDKVTKTFASLEEKMKRTEQGTDEHEVSKDTGCQIFM